MGKINLANIQRQMTRVEDAASGMELIGRPMQLPAQQIIPNPNNIAAAHDDAESIRQLADSIEIGGLIHPLTVAKTGERQYMLLSGERRYRAITTHLHWDSIACTVYEGLDEDQITLITVEANMEAREYSTADRLALYQQLDAALNGLKERGKFKGGIGRKIADMLGVSERQISAYRQIVNSTTAEERQQITNINKAVQEIRQSKKTYAERKFLGEEAPVEETPLSTPNSEKTYAQRKFLEEPLSSSAPPIDFATLDTAIQTTTERCYRIDGVALTREDADTAARAACATAQRKLETLMSWAQQTEQSEQLQQYLNTAHAALANAKAIMKGAS